MNPPPTSLHIPSLWVIPVHLPRASCTKIMCRFACHADAALVNMRSIGMSCGSTGMSSTIWNSCATPTFSEPSADARRPHVVGSGGNDKEKEDFREAKPRSLRFTWSMKTTSSMEPNEMMREIWTFLWGPCRVQVLQEQVSPGMNGRWSGHRASSHGLRWLQQTQPPSSL